MIKRSILIAAIAAFGFAATGSAQSVSGTDLYAVNLDTGELSLIAEIGSGEAVIGLAVLPSTEIAGRALALTTDNELVEFNVNSPGATGGRLQVSGLESGESLKGIDFRPANDELWAISDQSRLYSVDLSSGEATSIGGVFDPVLEDGNLGFDFNPTVDRIRVDVSTTQNLRLNPETGLIGSNPDTGAPTIDGNTVFADGDDNAAATPRVVGAAYTNSVPDAEETQLFVLDAETQTLALQDPPNDGVLNTIGSLGVDIVEWAAFDIHPSGEAFVSNPNLVDMPSTGTGTIASSPMMMSGGATAVAVIAGGAAMILRRNRTEV